jgi:hypothetical protein
VPDLPPWVIEWCRRFLGGTPATLLFGVSHLSEVWGVRLVDGREIVIKRRADDTGRTASCGKAQQFLAEQGFPCPLPLTDVIFDGGFATHAERLVAGGERELRDTPAAAARSAALLADLVRRLSALQLDPPLPNPEWVRSDAPLPARQQGMAAPAWLEDTSRRAQDKLMACDLSPVLGHADWESQNMVWDDAGNPLAVHDWDSLAFLPEATIAGTAAGAFATYGEPVLAPIESSEAFLDAYEGARGSRFSPCETEGAWAASIWVAIHNARDELVYDRPRLSYEGLKEQRLARLVRAQA